MTLYKVPCCEGEPFVGEFVPFYYCARSPMLYTINKGNTGLAQGCQKDIVHLVTKIGDVAYAARGWAVSDGNAGADHTAFYATEDALDRIDWPSIRSNDWAGKTHQKSAEFLVRDRVPWSAIRGIGCFDDEAVERVRLALRGITDHTPTIKAIREWYY